MNCKTNSLKQRFIKNYFESCFQMRLWALLVLVGVVSGANRTKRQFEAGHCDPAFCQIPVSDEGGGDGS